jgi:hypothetical protein
MLIRAITGVQTATVKVIAIVAMIGAFAMAVHYMNRNPAQTTRVTDATLDTGANGAVAGLNGLNKLFTNLDPSKGAAPATPRRPATAKP